LCFYNRSFNDLPTTNQRPDIVIEFAESGQMLIIDAKYRLGRSPECLAKYGAVGAEEEDINTLHRYRDAIVDPRAAGRRPVVAGVIAFPGTQAEAFRDHHFFRCWKPARLAGVP